ncbi:MAG: PAS domain S-box protein [Dehalococcoidia bacterium]|nr:PAS domain S-box protein [Dehalococcoidia bacterium]
MNLYSYREIVENSQDAIVLTNADGVIQIWNLGANKMFGYSPEEAVGQTLDIIIPDRFRDSHWDGFNNTMATGHSKYEEDMLSVPAIKKDGSRISIEFTIVMSKDDQGIPTGISAIIRDVSERRQQDKQMQDRVAELEERLKELGFE